MVPTKYGEKLDKPRLLRLPHAMAVYAPIFARLLPARDRVIDFGKHKGRMLGTLPSRYLTWVSKNLRARDFEDWARAADEVLRDPVYRDRIEWESAEQVLSGEGARSRGGESPVSELLEISDRFGWDNEDREGWKSVDLELLGTSKGGRIPRRKKGGSFGSPSIDGGRRPEGRKVGFLGKGQLVATEEEEEEEVMEGKRDERRERQRNKREQQKRKLKKGVAVVEEGGEAAAGNGGMKKLGDSSPSPFPGRDALLNRIRKEH